MLAIVDAAAAAVFLDSSSYSHF